MNTYKALTALFLITTIILGIMLYNEKNETVEEALTEPTAELQDCNASIARWKADNGNDFASSTDEAREELSDILEDCEASFE